MSLSTRIWSLRAAVAARDRRRPASGCTASIVDALQERLTHPCGETHILIVRIH